ncbi:hypothetical protein K1719_006103 [Acacia pycnantha]|nr:hypothetical protein K1719_006103 [Acacia pycnantha]
MVDKRCNKFFPKKYNPHTTIDHEGFPSYRRRDDGRSIEIKGIPLDNRFVVPYNHTLLSMFHAHINIEKCNQSTAIKYLFKYISKGNDRVVASIYETDQNGNPQRALDEIQQYYNFRYISACEAAWRIFGFDIQHRFPPVERLSFHLPDQQCVIYSNTDDVAEILAKPRVSESMFIAWMKQNKDDDLAKTLYYYEFPQYYVYHRTKRMWKIRKRGFAIGRLMHAAPSSGEFYYLRILLTKVKGPSSYEAIRTVDGVVHPTYRAACIALGLLDDDCEFVAALKEASMWAGCLTRPEVVWKETSQLLSEDLLHIPQRDPMSSSMFINTYIGRDKEQAALIEIETLLQKNGKSISDFPSLPLPSSSTHVNVDNHFIRQELNYNKVQLHKQSEQIVKSLNVDQHVIYNTVMSKINSGHGGFFFVYGYGGTGKTFLWHAFTSSIRSRGEIVLTVASSGIAATLLQSGRTAHSRFAIPIAVNEDSMCNIKQNSLLADLIKVTKLIIWDEAPMVQRFCIEAFDRTLKDIMHCNKPFGGKAVLMGGDFRQLLPVIPKASRATIVNACITYSSLWDSCTIFNLTKNMRLSCSSNQEYEELQTFSKWLLDIGDGNLGLPHDGIAQVEIPDKFLIRYLDNPMQAIVSTTYPVCLKI